MNVLKRLAVLAIMFVQFKDAEGSPVFLQNDDAPEGSTPHKDGYARDANGDKYPVGVRVYGPGSTEYRKAEDKINDENLKRGRKKLTGVGLRENATLLLARTTQEFVNFDVGGVTVTASTDFETRIKACTALYDDPEYVAIRDQVAEAQGDLANFTPNASTS